MADKRVKSQLGKDDKVRQLRASVLVQKILRGIETDIGAEILGIEADKSLSQVDRLMRIQEVILSAEGNIQKATRDQFILQYKAEIKASNDLLASLGYEKVTGYDSTTLKTLLDFDVDKVTKNVGAYVTDIRDTLTKLTLTGQGFNAEEIINPITGRIDRAVQTEVETLFSAFSRTVNAKKAENLGLDYFEYSGPDDDLARDFCSALLSKDPPIYSLAEIEEMNNQQGLPPLQYGGGYNCRHRWLPMDKEEADERGYEKGIPEEALG